MSEELFGLLEHAARSGHDAVFAVLSEKLRDQGHWAQLFEARLMQKRSELGLPLIQTQALGELPDPQRRAYEEAYITAAREVGGLFLERGDIVRAWPYFRAIGETAPVAAAIEQVQPGEGIEPIIEIAFHERVHPRKGFELLLANYGTCSAITSFEQYPTRDGREECVRVLVHKLHGDLVENLRQAIAQREGPLPDRHAIPQLIAGRDWLFEDNNYHIDTSHLAAVIRFSTDLRDPETLDLAIELCEYGKRLSPLFQYRGQPPFDNPYVDYGWYLRALRGDDPDPALDHFRAKVAGDSGDDPAHAPAQVVVELLARLGRYHDAIDVSVQHLSNVDPNQLVCPSTAQLCQMAGAHERLKQLARERGDLLGFAAAVLQSSNGST